MPFICVDWWVIIFTACSGSMCHIRGWPMQMQQLVSTSNLLHFIFATCIWAASKQCGRQLGWDWPEMVSYAGMFCKRKSKSSLLKGLLMLWVICASCIISVGGIWMFSSLSLSGLLRQRDDKEYTRSMFSGKGRLASDDNLKYKSELLYRRRMNHKPYHKHLRMLGERG